MKPKIIFVVQGPVESRSTDVDFDPNQSLIDLVNKMVGAGADVVVSTWHGGLSESEISAIERMGSKVLNSTRFMPPDGDSADERIRKLSNKALMYYTLEAGLKFIDKQFGDLNNCFVIKVRSDMDFDVVKLIDFVNLNKDNLNKRILVQYFEPFLFGLHSMRIPDFWFGGYFYDISGLNRLLLKKALEGRSFSNVSHYDISLSLLYKRGLKYVRYTKFIEDKRFLRPDDKFNFLLHNLFRFLNTLIFNLINLRYFVPCDRAIEMSIKWRGRIFYLDELTSFYKRYFH